MGEDKGALAERAKSGDRKAVSDLAALYGPELYRLALYLLNSEEEARDAAADIFARLLATPGIIPLDRFHAWLMRVAYNHCMDILRRRKTLNRLLPKIYHRMEEHLGPSPEQAAVEADEQAEVRQAVSGLPEQERVMVVLRYREAYIAPGAKIAGTTRWDRQEPPKIEKQNEGFSWLAQLAWFAAGILVWIVFTLLFPRLWGHLGGIIIESPLPALGWGFLLLVAAPLAALLLLITVIGIPISLTMVMAYSVLLYAGKIIIGDAVGRLLSRRFGWNGRVHEILPFMTAFAGLILLSKIPVAGFLINLVVASMAIGAVFLAFLRWRKLSGAPPAVECFQDE